MRYFATVDAQSSAFAFRRVVAQGLAETIRDLVDIDSILALSQSCEAMHNNGR